MALEAIIFDVDGTLANTEHDGHLKAFNEAFDFYGLDWYWDNELYAELLSVSGGKERLAYYIKKYNPDLKMPLSSLKIAEIHRKKTDIFISKIADGEISLRTGVERLINEAMDENLRLGIATTTSFENVSAILKSSLGKDGLKNFEIIGAGDVVKNKKPSPEIYNYVLEKMNLSPRDCIAIEDSEIGFNSSTASGLKTVVTLSEYTMSKNFTGALVVLDHLGEEDEPFQIVNGIPTNHTMVSVNYLKELYECTN
jgi:beta-phosphoglucomutase-like phosphatase (HAD superfamily)